MHHMGCGELVHARWKSRRLLAVVSLSFGVGETNCSQGRRTLLYTYRNTSSNLVLLVLSSSSRWYTRRAANSYPTLSIPGSSRVTSGSICWQCHIKIGLHKNNESQGDNDQAPNFDNDETSKKSRNPLIIQSPNRP